MVTERMSSPPRARARAPPPPQGMHENLSAKRSNKYIANLGFFNAILMAEALVRQGLLDAYDVLYSDSVRGR